MIINDKKARIIAFYLPQFHPIPENDTWWGKGFTEWTNVAKAKPIYKDHYQPKIPADLGFYDLRLPEVRDEQAKLAKEAGIEGFCYWHYWFGNGKQLLERPFKEVLSTGKPDFPFCIGWANHSWSNKTWEKGDLIKDNRLLMEQTYSDEDYVKHFNYLLSAFKDKRYITVEGKPIFVIYDPLGIPNANCFISLWNKLAIENGLKGIYFIGITSNSEPFKLGLDVKLSDVNQARDRYKKILDLGFDGVNSRGFRRAEILQKGKWNVLKNRIINKIFKGVVLDKYEYSKIINDFYVEEDKWNNVYPTILPNWDRSARSGKNATIYHGSTPDLFKKNIQLALDLVCDREFENRIIFLQSWNEWAEGNYVEPDLKFGRKYLDSIKEMIL